MDIITSIIPICPSTNNDGERIAEIKGTNDNTLMKVAPSKTPAIIAK